MTTAELTPRQTEIIQLIQQGFNADEIAGKLCISKRTVGYHKASIFRVLGKYGIRNNTQLLKFTLRELQSN